MWQYVAGAAAAGVLENMLSGRKQMAVIEAETARIANKVSAANADSANKLRTSANVLAAAQGAAARWEQSINNQRIMRAGGQALEAATVNTLRQRDAATIGSFAENIRAAEAAGAAAASQAAAGVGGDVVDMVNVSTALRDSIVEQRTASLRGSAAWDAGRYMGGVLQQMTSSLDSSLLLEGLDYNKTVAQERSTTPRYTPSYLQSALTGAIRGAVGSMQAGVADFSLDKIPGVGEWFKAETKANLVPVKAGQSFGLRTIPASQSMYSLI